MMPQFSTKSEGQARHGTLLLATTVLLSKPHSMQEAGAGGSGGDSGTCCGVSPYIACHTRAIHGWFGPSWRLAEQAAIVALLERLKQRQLMTDGLRTLSRRVTPPAQISILGIELAAITSI